MKKEIQNIVSACPRSSTANPKAREDSATGDVIVRAGSPADACRFVDAIRRGGYSANVDPWDALRVIVKA